MNKKIDHSIYVIEDAQMDIQELQNDIEKQHIINEETSLQIHSNKYELSRVDSFLNTFQEMLSQAQVTIMKLETKIKELEGNLNDK